MTRDNNILLYPAVLSPFCGLLVNYHNSSEAFVIFLPRRIHVHVLVWSFAMTEKANPKNEQPDDLVNATPLGVLGLIETSEEHHPVHWPAWKKWGIAITYCLLQVAVALLSTSYISAETVIKEKFGGTSQVIALGQSLFIIGTAVGPAFLGPLSDIGGRKWVYVGSIAVYGLLQIVCIALLEMIFQA